MSHPSYSGISGTLFFKCKNVVFDGVQEKESIICLRVGKKNLSIAITVCHHLASLIMPIGEPQDGFFYLSLMIDSFITCPKKVSLSEKT